MMGYENYKNNIDVVDKYDLKEIKIGTGRVYTGKTEYVNPQIKQTDHTSPLLASAVLGLDNTGIPLPENSKFLDVWTDIDAQERHLNTKPTCYVILGKSEEGAFRLGEGMAKKYNIIHLCPKNILLDDLSQHSNTGRTLEFNMKMNKVVLYDTILTMLKIKLSSEVIQHRGYVISGLPFVTSQRNHFFYINSMHSEEAFLFINEMLFEMIRNIKKKKKKESPGSAPSSASSKNDEEEEVTSEHEEEIDLEEEEEEDKPAELPKFILDTCSDVIINKKPRSESQLAALLCQLDDLFNLFLKPDIVIHMTCPEMDFLKMRSKKFINYKTELSIIQPFVSNYTPEPSWPHKCYNDDSANPHASNVFNPKYNCKPPFNYQDKVIDQICSYKTYVYPYIQKKLKDMNPKMIIELDGRTSASEMLHHVAERLILMKIEPVIIPQPLFLEDSPEDMEEFWTSTVAELEFIKSGDLNFKYYASPWYNRCPVELKLRRSVIGKPKYAVMFLKHVYIMSSLNNFIAFYRNPRPYLKLKYLEPICRVVVTGTKRSGKTMISQCLSWIFDAPIINFKAILETEKDKKYVLIAKTILSEVIATIEDVRHLEWQMKEIDREAILSEWCKSTLELLQTYLPLLIEKTQYDEKQALLLVRNQQEAEKAAKQERKKEKEETIEVEGDVEEEYEMEGELNEEVEESEKQAVMEIVLEEMNPVSLSKFHDLKTQLSILPILNNIEECQTVLTNQSMIRQYAPIDLLTVAIEPSIPVIGDEDVTIAITKYIADNDLQKDLEPTMEELMTEVVKFIAAIDTQHEVDTQSDQLYGKYIIDGFPSGPEYWEYISDSKLLPDYTIAIIENREIDEELCQYYCSADKQNRRYDEKILSANDPLIYTKLQAMKVSQLKETLIDMQNIVTYMINDTLDLIFRSKLQSTTTIEPSDADVQTKIGQITEDIEKFREDWDSLKLKVEEKSKSYIEIELDDKKDVEVIDEVLKKLRYCYRPTEERFEDDEPDEYENDQPAKDLLNFNDSRFLCETTIYCPIAYYVHGVLWEGNREFSLKYDNKIHYFCKEEFLELFTQDITKYQFYNIPFKKVPKLKICVIGSIGSGATSLSKHIAKELGLLHIDFTEAIHEYMVPKHFKKIGRHYENMFTDETIDEQGVVEFQVDEENVNLVSNILGNESELTRMLNDYFERGAPVLPKLMENVIKKIWFGSGSPIGFVLDGYPKLPSDAEDMLACYAIPDLVIKLENNVETAIDRMSPIMFKSWQSQQKDAKKAAALKLDNERMKWQHSITKKVLAKLIIEDIFDNFMKLDPLARPSSSTDSEIIDAHPALYANIDPRLFNTYNEMVEEYPEPQDTNVWEKNDDARERIESRIEGIFDTDDENIQSLNEVLIENRIKTLSIDSAKPLNKVIRNTLTKLSTLKNRCESFFEQTFIVNVDIAETLISRGFYFFSKFYRVCPVYIFENPQAMQNSYNIAKRKGTLLPVIHRSCIYFINSADNVTKFRRNPLKYITSDAIKSYFEYPLRIGVIGTSKSGKSTLAARLAKQYGLLCISEGSAVRNVLENLNWTELAVEITECLKAGKKIEEDHIVKAVQTVAIHPLTATSGYVLDGSPVTPYRAKGHVKNCIFPNIIFEICSSKSRILENSQNEIYYEILKYMPPYPYDLIQIRYENWERRHHKIRSWIDENYQNLYPIDGNQSKWNAMQQVSDHLKLINSKFHYYASNVEKKIVRAMWISVEEFQSRQSQYKNMCPVCLHKKVYKHMGSYFGGKKGVVQYQKKFYWICDEHIDLVLAFPDNCLTSIDVEIPELPALINIVNLDYIYENGICVVTYAENLPAQIIKIGTNKFAASYAGKSYLFCSDVCLCKFISKPYLYKDITIFKESKSFPKLTLKNLPNIGYLEQTLGNVLTEACCSVNAFRPKYPGLSFQTSAFIYIGLYLKTHNPITDKSKLPMYLKAFRVFEARCKLILNIGLRLRSMDNPFAAYPKCIHRKPTLNPADVEQEPPLCLSQIQKPVIDLPKTTSNLVQLHRPSYFPKLTRRVPVPDERFDYLCEFHKPVSKVPAFLNVVDIAGLVKGAAEGQGLGNAFLSHIKACDAIFNLCRAFDDEDVIHVDGEVNPVRDLETIGEELRLKDEEQLVQNFEKLDKLVNRGGDKKLKSEYDSLTKIKTVLVDEKKHIRFGDWSAADIEVLNKYLFLTSKPALYLVNLSEKDYIRKKNKWLPKLKEWIDKNDPGAPLIPFSGSLEMKLFDMEPAERQAFLKENNLTSALDKIIVQGYKALQLEYFFTAGPDEVKAWTIQKGTKAPQAAGRIHTDFEKGFIMAEVMHYKDFKEEGTEAACKAAGKYRQQGRNYVVEDGDIIFFKFNAGAGLKDPKKK